MAASTKPSSRSDHRADPNPAAALAATTTQQRHSMRIFDPYCTLLVAPAAQLTLRLLRGGAPAEVARDAFPHLNPLLLNWSVLRFYNSPRGSPARARARLAFWVLATTLAAATTCKVAAHLPLGFAAVAWVMAVAIVGFGLYGLLFHEER